MTEKKNCPKTLPYEHLGVQEMLAEHGIGPKALDALAIMDAANFQWRRMMERGEIWSKMTEGMEDKLESALMQGLVAVAMLEGGHWHTEPRAPTIGLVAESMSVDPSRASRIVADLVSRGFLARGVAQDDARRSILIVTDKGHAYLRDFTLRKWRLLADVFADWTEEEITAFSGLFARYVDQLGAALRQPD